MPDISQASKDEAAIVKAELGRLERLRAVLAVPFFFVGAKLMPPRMREVANRQRMVSEHEGDDEGC